MTLDPDHLAALDAAATPGHLQTAERHTIDEYVECPFCQGQGEVDAVDYCNFDGVALGVQFYGIGKEFGAHEALWRYLRNAVPDIIAMARENERLREALRRVIDAPMIDHRNPENGYRQIARAALENRDD